MNIFLIYTLLGLRSAVLIQNKKSHSDGYAIKSEVKMKKMIVAILISSLLISGCAYNITKGDYEDNQKFYERVNKVCEDKDEFSIITNNNKSYKGKKLIIANDTTSFTDLEFNSLKKINTNNISKIEFRGTGSSTFEGLLFGGLAGGLVANILSNPAPGEAVQGKAIYLLLGVAGGAIIGIIYSIINPSNTTIFITK